MKYKERKDKMNKFHKAYFVDNIRKYRFSSLINKPPQYTICCTCGNQMEPRRYPSCKSCYIKYSNGYLYKECQICGYKFYEPQVWGSCFFCYCRLEKDNEKENR